MLVRLNLFMSEDYTPAIVYKIQSVYIWASWLQLAWDDSNKF